MAATTIGPTFIPSRGRDLRANSAMAVAGTQPSGRALPSLIVGPPTTPAEHVRAAMAVSPVASLINAAVPGGAKVVLAAIIRDPTTVAARREGAIATFREVCDTLEPYRARWAGALEADSPARMLNLPLLHVLAKRSGYVDSSIVDDIARGMPIAGDILPSGALLPREKAAETTLGEWAKGMSTRNAETIARVEKFRNSNDGVECWGKTKKEIDAGCLTKPVCLTSDMAESLCLPPRFAIFQEGKGGGTKCASLMTCALLG